MDKAIVISHSSRDNEFVSKLCQAMESQGLYNWVDSSHLRGGNELTAKIHETIEKARAFIVVISSDAFNSAWVADETRHAARLRENRRENYPIIALLREGVELGALKWIFSKEPVAIRVKNDLSGIRIAMPHIMAALGEPSLINDLRDTDETQIEPLEELVLELRSAHMRESDGRRRAAAQAELTYIPASFKEPRVRGTRVFLFTSPLGPIEIEELRWYLERYYLWPTGIFRTRAENVEKKLPEWGHELYREVIPEMSSANIVKAWKAIDSLAERRFTIFVDSRPDRGVRGEWDEADEAAALLLGVPWELIHDGDDYLFHGARSVRARRRLPKG